MLFHLYCKDKTGLSNMRASSRSAHLKYLSSFEDKVKLAGPILDEDGQVVVGSVFVFEAEDMDEVQAFAKGDPYRKIGLFETVEIKPFRQTLPATA